MATGLAEAQLARIPMVVVVGDAPSTGRRPFDIDQHTVTAGMNIPVVTIEPAHAGANITRAFEMAADGQEPVVVMLPCDVADAPATDAAVASGYEPRANRGGAAAPIAASAHALVT